MLTRFHSIILSCLAVSLSIGSARAQGLAQATTTPGAAAPPFIHPLDDSGADSPRQSANSGAAHQQPGIALARINAGGGWAAIGGSYHRDTELGGDLLLPVDSTHRYGLRFSSLDINNSGNHQRYFSTGIVLEMVMFQWFRMEIGTIGYLGRGEISGSNPFGLVSFLGYEKRLGRLQLSIGYDSKVIFAKSTIVINNLGIGLGVYF